MKNPPSKSLTADESKALARHEAIISTGFRTFYEVGCALLDISDRRLYRQTHSTFEIYCKEKWSMSAREAYRLCEAAGVGKLIDNANATNLSQTPLPKPDKESTAKALSHLEPADALKVWAEATKDGTQPTTKELNKIIDEKVTPKPEVEEKPKTETPPIVTKSLRRMSVQKLLDRVTNSICEVENHFPGEIELLIADLETHLDRLKSVKTLTVLPLERKEA